MDRRPGVSAAFILEQAKLLCGLFSRQEALHDDACENERFAVEMAHGVSFLRIVLNLFLSAVVWPGYPCSLPHQAAATRVRPDVKPGIP
jgi:hypothetical protein